MPRSGFYIIHLLWAFFCLGARVGAEEASCPREPEVLPAALHEAVAGAEKIAEGGDYAKAADVLNRRLQKHPDGVLAYPYYDLGYFHHKAGEFDAAVKNLNIAVKRNPCFSEAWQLLAAARHDGGRFKQAARAMERAASLTGDAEMHYQAAVFRLRAGQPKQAVGILEPLLEKKRPAPDWFVAMANARRDLKQPDRAADAMASAARISGDVEFRYEAALLWLEAKSPKKALPLLQSLAKESSPRPEWLVAMSNALQALKKKEETARAMERAARISGNPDLLFHAAWLWMEADRPKKALPLLRKLSGKKKPKTNWLIALVSVLVTLERIPEAANAMERVIARNPDPEHLYNGGALWLQARQAGKALPHLRRLCGMPSPKADWFVALGSAWLQSGDVPKAAEAMERAAHISGKPGHAYQAGVLRVQLKQADASLKLLLPLGQLPRPEAEWMIAISNAWLLKERYGDAAGAMERAAQISGKADHSFQAARLWLQADRPLEALPLLKGLADLPTPRGKWLLLLSNTHLMLDDIPGAAGAMERAAGVTGKGEHYFRAAMLRRQMDNLEKAIALLEIAIRRKPVKQRWLIELAAVFIEVEREKEAESVMARTTLTDGMESPEIRFRGAVLWLNLQRPRKALPILEALCETPRPGWDWLVSLVKTGVELGRIPLAEKALNRLLDGYPEKLEAWELAVWAALQQSDFVRASAAMEVAVRLDPTNVERLKQSSRLYHMAGAPVKAVRAFRDALGPRPLPMDWDHMVDIYLSGGRYDLALAPAKAAAEAGESARRWEAVGDIAYHLHRFEESRDAYQRAATLSDAGGIRMKTGYALLKMDRLELAADFFRQALDRSGDKRTLAREAVRNLAYIENVQKRTPD